MRNLEDYNKLVAGYSLSLSLLKLIDKKMYRRIIHTKELLNKYGAKFAELVRNLKVDFINENDTKGADQPKIVTIDRGLYKEMFALSYSPENDYIFAMLYEKHSILGVKRIFCEIVPRSIEDIQSYTISDVFRISLLDEYEKVAKVYNYIAGVADGSLYVFKQDVDKENYLQDVLEIKIDELTDNEEINNMF